MSDYRLRYRAFQGKSSQIVTKEKSFKSVQARESWISRQIETSSTFLEVVAYSDGE